jgi:hypothetical protein
MRLTLSLLVCAICFISCQKNDRQETSINISGAYAGTFVRSGRDTASIELNLTQSAFSGSSSIPKYPAICKGTYNPGESTIEFKDACPWTADFDWTLILDGTYNWQATGDEIVFWRITGSIKDEYRLKRISR